MKGRKTKMKKIIAITLVLIMTLSLFACGKGSTNTNKRKKDPTPTITTTDSQEDIQDNEDFATPESTDAVDKNQATNEQIPTTTDNDIKGQETSAPEGTQASTESPSSTVDQVATVAPTTTHTQKPTVAPTKAPTQKPTVAPTKTPTQKPVVTPDVKPTQPDSNNVYIDNSLPTKYEDGKISIRPIQMYWDDGILVAKCYVINGLNERVYYMDVRQIKFYNAQGSFADGGFGIVSNIKIEPHSYTIHTFTFGGNAVDNYGASLSEFGWEADIIGNP